MKTRLMMCDVCYEPLNVFTPEASPRDFMYVHGRQTVDHKPVPVPLDPAAVIRICDFCKSPHDRPMWVHVTREDTSSQRAYQIG